MVTLTDTVILIALLMIMELTYPDDPERSGRVRWLLMPAVIVFLILTAGALIGQFGGRV